MTNSLITCEDIKRSFEVKNMEIRRLEQENADLRTKLEAAEKLQQGMDSRINGEPFDITKSNSWKLGWHVQDENIRLRHENTEFCKALNLIKELWDGAPNESVINEFLDKHNGKYPDCEDMQIHYTFDDEDIEHIEGEFDVDEQYVCRCIADLVLTDALQSTPDRNLNKLIELLQDAVTETRNGEKLSEGFVTAAESALAAWKGDVND